MTHVDDQALLSFTLGQLEGEPAAGIEQHLAACAACRERQENISSAAFSKTAVGSSNDGEPTRDERGGAGAVVLQRGATLGRYVVLEKLGAGGMGEVFAAYDPHLDRKVAIKLLRGGALSAEEGKARLLREAQAMARLQHPNVIAVHDVGLFGERVFVAMEYVDGETLGDWLRGQRAWDEVVRVFVQAGAGLAAAHRAGIVHRDFKPDNVLLGPDARPRVLDFGLARQATGGPAVPENKETLERALDATLAAPLTRDGAVMGTPGYMPPEQINGLPTDARSDQFSFCVALFEGLYGQRPFSGATLKQHAAAIASGRVPEPPSGSDVPGWVREALVRGLSANPADRWPDMERLLAALRPRARRSPRRTLFVAALVAFSVFGLGYGAWARQRMLVCGGTEKALVGTWDAARKARLQANFHATGLSFADEAWKRTERALDTWAVEYLSTAREVCEAGKVRKVDPPEVTDLKSGCLEERLQQLAALVSIFEHADHDVVNNAPVAARELQGASVCTSATRGHHRAGADEQERQADVKLHAALAEAQALFAAGKYAAGAQRLQAGLSPAAPPGTLAEAYLWLARIELRRGEHKLARQANLQASEQALKSGDPSLTSRAFSRLAANEGSEEASAESDAWSRLAAAAAARAPGDWELQVELAKDDGYIQLRRRNFKAALAEFERVLALQQQHLGDEHPDVASTQNNLGTALTRLGQYDEAVKRYHESLRLHELVEGPEHPNVASALHNLSVALRRLGRLEEARDALERALTIRRKALGANHPETLRVAQGLVKVLVTLDALIDARTLLEDVKDTSELLHGAESVEMLGVLELEVELLIAGAFWPEAQEAATRHLALARQLGAAGEREVPTALLEQAVAWRELGTWQQAGKALEEAQRRVERGGTSVKLPEVKEARARVELAQGRAAAAVALFREALELREQDAAPSSPQALGALELGLAQALLESRQLADAETIAARAEQRLAEQRAERLLVEARVVRAQAQHLGTPDAGTGARLLELLPLLPEWKRPRLGTWLSQQGLSPDAGTTAR